MHIVNRIIIVVILLAIIAFAFLAIINEFTGLFNWSDIASRLFDPGNNIPAWASVLALLFVIGVCAYLLYLELRIRRTMIARVRNVESGKAMITLETVSNQVKNAVLAIEGLRNLKVDIAPKSGGVIISMLVELVQNQNIPEKTAEIIKTAEMTATDKLDIKVIDTKVTITNLLRERDTREDRGPVIPGAATQEIREMQEEKDQADVQPSAPPSDTEAERE